MTHEFHRPTLKRLPDGSWRVVSRAPEPQTAAPPAPPPPTENAQGSLPAR